MGRPKLAVGTGALFHVTLKGWGEVVVIEAAEEWRAFGELVARVSQSCAVQVYAYASDGRDIHLALETSQVHVGAVTKRITSPLARHINRRRGSRGPVFRPFRAVAVDRRLYLVDLVLYVHLSLWSRDRGQRRWSSEAAYLGQADLPGICTRPVLDELGHGAQGIREYRTQRARGMSSRIAALFERGSVFPLVGNGVPHRSLEDIARRVVEVEKVSYDELLSVSRRRCVSRARSMVAVVAVREGISLATVAAFLKRHPSSLIKGMGRYRAHSLGALGRISSEPMQCVSAAVTSAVGLGVTER